MCKTVTKKSQISGLVITLNEENNIADCIKSLQCVCDDIVIVDSFSTDNTAAIAKQLGATVLVQKFLGDGPQRSAGLPHCKHEWILNLDADERLEKDCVDFIRSLNLKTLPTDVYEFRRLNYIGNKLTRHAGQYPDYVARLFNKTSANFSNKQTHTKVQGHSHIKVNAHITHYSYTDYADLYTRQCRYAVQMGKELGKTNQSFISPFSPIIHGTWSFFRHFLLKKGFLAGFLGLNISMAKSMGSFIKYVVAIDQQKKRSR